MTLPPSADAQTLEETERLAGYLEALKGLSALEAPSKWEPTEETAAENFYRRGAPFRGKITPPGFSGPVLLIGGRVWGLKSRAPLRNSVIEVWQPDPLGRHDNDDPAKAPPRDVYLNRARLITDETGYYEFETVQPGPFKTPSGQWRPGCINCRVQYPGYRTVTTRIYFRGDAHQDKDDQFKPSLAIDLAVRRVGNVSFKTGRFDIVLEPTA